MFPYQNTIANRESLAAQLDNLEDTGFIRQLNPEDLPLGSSPNVAALTTAANGIVYIVSGGAFFPRTVNGHALGGFASGMTLPDFQQLVFLHEFLHWEGLAGEDSNHQKYQLPNGDTVTGTAGISKEVQKKCFN